MKIKGLFLLTLIVFLFISTGFVYSENMIKNTSFEESTPNGTPLDWRTQSWAKGVENQFGIDSGVAHSGNQSVFINNNEIQNHGYYIQGVSVKENSYYKISGWVKTENIAQGAEGAGISLINYFEVGGNVKGTTDWQYAELYVSTGPGISQIEIMLQVGNYGALTTGKAWFDDITMEKVNSIPPGKPVSSVSSKEVKTEPEAVKDTGEEGPKTSANQGTFIFILIAVIVVVIAGIVVIVIIIITRKKPKDDTEKKEKEPDESGKMEEDEEADKD